MAASDWECFKGSPEKMGSSDNAAPGTPYLLWEVDLGSELHASPVVKDDKVFQVASGELFCIDLTSGEIIWKSPVPAYYSTPALPEDKVIVATNHGIVAYSIEKGDLLWDYQMSVLFSRYPIENYIQSSPVISEGRIVVGAMPLSYTIIDGLFVGRRNELFVFCVDETGKEKWYTETTLGVCTSPCVTHGKVFAASREMVCIDLKRGNTLWNSEDKYPHDFEKPIKERYAFDLSTPILYHGIVIGGSSNMERVGTGLHYIGWQKIVFIDQYTGYFLWEWEKEGISASSPALYRGKVYTYSLDGVVRCISFLDGRDLWDTPISEPEEFNPYAELRPSPTVADHKVFIGSIAGDFYCLDSDTGEMLWTYETGGRIYSSPAVVSGRVLISSTEGKLYCFGIDPDTYLVKAQDYLEEGEIEKAQQFLVKAKEYAETEEEITEIEDLLTIVDQKMPEYEEKMEKIKEAESLMDEADKIMWDKKFGKAHDLYSKAYTIFQEVDDEFGEAFCMERLEYIAQRMPEETTGISYWLGILALCGVIACLVIWKIRKSHKQ